jgi:hypothetical protein
MVGYAADISPMPKKSILSSRTSAKTLAIKSVGSPADAASAADSSAAWALRDPAMPTPAAPTQNAL